MVHMQKGPCGSVFLIGWMKVALGSGLRSPSAVTLVSPGMSSPIHVSQSFRVFLSSIDSPVGRDPIAVFTITDLGQLPEGFTDGEVVTGQVHGELLIRGVTAPLTFDVKARDDGDVVFIIGRTTFTWDDLQIAKPTARPVVSVEDEVRVEVLLSVTPKLASEG